MPSSRTKALTPGPSRRYVSQSVPTTLDANSSSAEPASPVGRKSDVWKLYSTAPASHSSFVFEAWKSWLKSLLDEDAHGKLQPIRVLYAWIFASGARDTTPSVTS